MAVLDPVAVLIATLAEGLSVSPPVKGYSHDPGFAGLDSLPAAVVGLPTIQRTGVDEAETQFGTDDWYISYPVSLIFDLADLTVTHDQATQTVEAFIRAIDTASLSVSDASILDAKVTEATPTQVVDDARPVLTYELKLEVHKIV